MILGVISMVFKCIYIFWNYPLMLEEDKEVNFNIDFNSRQAHEILRSLLNYEMV